MLELFASDSIYFTNICLLLCFADGTKAVAHTSVDITSAFGELNSNHIWSKLGTRWTWSECCQAWLDWTVPFAHSDGRFYFSSDQWKIRQIDFPYPTLLYVHKNLSSIIQGTVWKASRPEHVWALKTLTNEKYGKSTCPIRPFCMFIKSYHPSYRAQYEKPATPNMYEHLKLCWLILL